MKTIKRKVGSLPKIPIVRPTLSKEELYDTDFYQWTKTQASLLKKRELAKLDIDNLREEIESLGKSDKRALRSHLKILLLHLLKEKYQKKKSKSWTLSINNAREEIKYILEDSPSLKIELNRLMNEAYPGAREKAAHETKLNIKNFPEECPWNVKEIIS